MIRSRDAVPGPSTAARMALIALAAFVVPAAATAQSARAGRADALLRAYHDAGRFNGVALLLDGGEVLYRGAFGLARRDPDVANEVDTRFRIASLTKQFTAATVLRLWERGELDLDAPIRRYIPEYPAPQGDRVTVHHLLTHTSGIPSYTDIPGFLDEHAEEPLAPGEIVALTWSEPLEFEPGTRFAYDNTGYVLLGWIIERVSGRPYEEVLRELVLDPVGLEATGYDHDRAPAPGHAAGFRRVDGGLEPARPIDPSLPFSAGMLYSTVGDLARWAAALSSFERGRPFDRPETLERMLTPDRGGYAYGISVVERAVGREDTVRVLQHSGGIFGFSSVLRVFPDDGRAIVLLDNTGSALGPIAEDLTGVLWGTKTEGPRPSIAERLAPIVESAGAEAALRRYATWKRTRPDEYDYGPEELPKLAARLVAAGDTAGATAILEAQTEAFPADPAGWAALGALLAARGDTTHAAARLAEGLGWRPGEPALLRPLLELGVEPPAPLRAPVVSLPPETLDRLTGAYRIDPATSLEVSRENDGLVARRTGEEAFPLLPQTETAFLLQGSATRLVFEVDGGRATAVTVLESGRRVTFPRLPDRR